jgi:excisionase family DNA binding protein
MRAIASNLTAGLPVVGANQSAANHSPSPAVRHQNHADFEPLGLSAAEAAMLLGVSESHFYCLHKTGRLGPLPVRMGRAVRWSRQELVDWFNAGSPPRKRWLAIHTHRAANW